MTPDDELRQTAESEAPGNSYHELPILPRLTELKKPIRDHRKSLDRWVHVRLNEDEEKALHQLQEALQEKNRSDLLRKMIRESIGQGPDLLSNDLNIFREAVRQLGAVGRNINQIARALNSGQVTGFSMDPQLFTALTQQIDSLKAELMKVVMRSHNRWVQRG